MATYKVAELEGALLDASVAKAEGFNVREDGRWRSAIGWELAPRFSADWQLAGPIIERERIVTVPTTGYEDDGPTFWAATCLGPEGAFSHYIDEPLPFSTYRDDPAAAVGATPLIAAMRAFVASRLGETVDLP
jgi:hypothetical protein